MTAEGPHLVCLCEEVLLVVWTLHGEGSGAHSLKDAEGEAVAPLSCLKLRCEGGIRLIWAFKRPGGARSFLVSAGEAGQAAIAYDRAALPQASAEIFVGLAPRAKQSLLAALVSSWPNLYKLHASPSFARALCAFLLPPEGKGGLPPEGKGGRLTPLASAAGAVALETLLPARFGEPTALWVVGESGLSPQRAAFSTRPKPTAAKMRSCRFVLSKPDNAQASLVVLRGAQGFVARLWDAPAAVPTLERWWKSSHRSDEGLRQELIGLFNRHSKPASAAAREFQLRCPLPTRLVRGNAALPAAQIELALSGPSGTLIGGWYRDPGGFVDGFDVLDDRGETHSLDVGRHEFAGAVAGPNETRTPVTGFVCRSPAVAGTLLQPRILLRLNSGVRHLLVPPVQPSDWSDCRAAALRAVPPQAVSDALLDQCLAPTLAEIQDEAKQAVGSVCVRAIGPAVARPRVSLVVPLYKVLDFLPFQIAAFAADPLIAGKVEIIYVLDSPEQADAVEHLLTGLHLVYGLSLTLAVMPRNGGYSLANNRAAAFAHGTFLALVNSDVIPIEPGWLDRLTARLEASDGAAGSQGPVGLVGPKLLFEDDSLQHAGLFFARDHRGRWLNHHYFKGMPRHYAPARAERPVPGVTGACMVMRRSLFEAVGGFTEDYVIGDYEDSDLCLKIRQAGHDILYVPSVELYHLERRSMRQSASYMRGIASHYNSWLHEQRWGSSMNTLMTGRFASNPSLSRAA